MSHCIRVSHSAPLYPFDIVSYPAPTILQYAHHHILTPSEILHPILRAFAQKAGCFETASWMRPRVWILRTHPESDAGTDIMHLKGRFSGLSVQAPQDAKNKEAEVGDWSRFA